MDIVDSLLRVALDRASLFVTIVRGQRGGLHSPSGLALHPKGGCSIHNRN